MLLDEADARARFEFAAEGTGSTFCDDAECNDRRESPLVKPVNKPLEREFVYSGFALVFADVPLEFNCC